MGHRPQCFGVCPGRGLCEQGGSLGYICALVPDVSSGIGGWGEPLSPQKMPELCLPQGRGLGPGDAPGAGQLTAVGGPRCTGDSDGHSFH